MLPLQHSSIFNYISTFRCLFHSEVTCALESVYIHTSTIHMKYVSICLSKCIHIYEHKIYVFWEEKSTQ